MSSAANRHRIATEIALECRASAEDVAVAGVLGGIVVVRQASLAAFV